MLESWVVELSRMTHDFRLDKILKDFQLNSDLSQMTCDFLPFDVEWLDILTKPKN